MVLDQLQKKILTPAVLAEKDQFIMKFAETPEEVEGAQRLRYRVFNLEQGKGLDSAESEGIDRDEFDEHCLHLIVVEKSSGEAVGTYRIHLGVVAKSGQGFYSSREYDIEGIDEIADEAIEVGRSCVAPEYRTGAVVALLWSGISETLMRSGMRYLLGCVSLETTQPVIGWALYRHFGATDKHCQTLNATPVSEFTLPQADGDDIESFLANRREVNRAIPPLFKGYLRLGAKICGEPALDHEFGTTDFLILVDTQKVPERYIRHFSVKENGDK